MSRMLTVLVLTPAVLIMLTGCEEVVKDDPRFRVDPAQEALAVDTGYAVPEPSEVDLVENMAAHRAAYRAWIEKLLDHYMMTGDATKAAWARKELESLSLGAHYKYLMPAEMAPPNLSAQNMIAGADQMYQSAMDLYRQAGGLVIIKDEDKLRQSLTKFNRLIAEYPTSDKIDDAAYRAGQVYEYFDDYEIAVVYYQRAFQWDEYTPYPARFKAARLMDKRLKMKDEALTLYQMAIEKEARYKANTDYARERVLELSKLEPVNLQ